MDLTSKDVESIQMTVENYVTVAWGIANWQRVVRRVFADLLPPTVVVREGAPEECANLGQLFPEEVQAIERAVKKRRTQYAATRHLARQAMHALGISSQPVLNAPDRSPVWPEATVGSITHADTWCGVAMARKKDYLGIGIDVEDAEPLSERIAARVLTESEDAFLRRHDPADRLKLAKLYFSAKEAFYKCQYRQSQQFLGFEEVQLEFDLSLQTFHAKLLVEATAFPQGVGEVEGRYTWSEDVVATCAVCAHRANGRARTPE